MQFAHRKTSDCLTTASTLVLLLLALLSPLAAHAQNDGLRPTHASGSSGLRRVIHEFIGLSGYWFTDSSAVQALGTPKFGGVASLYVRPARRGPLVITGGLEFARAGDHWFPLSGGNRVNFNGLSFRVGAERGKLYRLVPFFTGGVYVGELRSEQQNYRATQIIPGMVFGAEMKVHRYITLVARYRMSARIGDVNTDGFNMSLKLF
jgi:hypothetical protein